MARPNKKHHKIPATYLENFTDSNGNLWVADREFKIYSQTPSGLLTENDYYTIHFPDGGGTLVIETKYLGGIEGSYADLYKRKIGKFEQITKREKATLAIFVASMMERQPMARESLKKFFSDAEEMITHLRGLPDDVKKRAASLPIASGSGPSISADELLEAAKDVGSLHSSLIPNTVSGTAPIIFNMNFAFLVGSKDSKPFLTSDNPFTMINPIAENRWGRGTIGASPGLVQEDVEITLPLSSNVVLMCGWQYKGDCDYLPLSSELVDEINRRTARHAGIIIGADKGMLEQIVERVKRRQSEKQKKL